MSNIPEIVKYIDGYEQAKEFTTECNILFDRIWRAMHAFNQKQSQSQRTIGTRANRCYIDEQDLNKLKIVRSDFVCREDKPPMLWGMEVYGVIDRHGKNLLTICYDENVRLK